MKAFPSITFTTALSICSSVPSASVSIFKDTDQLSS